MKRSYVYFVCTAITILLLTGCSSHIKKTGDDKYIVNYKSYKSEEDARKQAIFYATLECTSNGKKFNILNEKKETKRGYFQQIEFECID